MALISSSYSFIPGPDTVEDGTFLPLPADPIPAVTAKSVPFRGYMPIAVVKNDLRTSFYGEHVEITGRIFDHSGSKPISDACIEVWHLSAVSEEYKHRARIYTDMKGRYGFVTDLPARENGKNFHIYFKILVDGANYYTKLSFNHCLYWLATRYKKSQLGGEQLLLDKKSNTPADRPYILDIKLVR